MLSAVPLSAAQAITFYTDFTRRTGFFRSVFIPYQEAALIVNIQDNTAFRLAGGLKQNLFPDHKAAPAVFFYVV